MVSRAVKKLPPSPVSEALPYSLTCIMTFVVSGVATFHALGFVEGAILRWLESWVISWAIIFPVIFFLMPAVRGLLARIIAEKSPSDHNLARTTVGSEPKGR